MLYEEARVYLDHVSKYGSVLGLDSIKSLLGELGNPQKDLKFIHIAGTNGKDRFSPDSPVSCSRLDTGPEDTVLRP